MDQRASGSTVAVDEWVDGLELRVRDRRLSHCRQGVAV
jgi:hypothetical protein